MGGLHCPDMLVPVPSRNGIGEQNLRPGSLRTRAPLKIRIDLSMSPNTPVSFLLEQQSGASTSPEPISWTSTLSFLLEKELLA